VREGLDRAGRDTFRIVGLRDIRREKRDVTSARQRFGGSCEPLFASRAQEDRRAFIDKHFGDASADAFARAGDECRFSF
jgi:hypothetical protein